MYREHMQASIKVDWRADPGPVLLLPVFVSSSNGNRHFPRFISLFPPLYRFSHCNLHALLCHRLPASLAPFIFLDLLSDIVMAMQNKQTVLIAAGFSVGTCLPSSFDQRGLLFCQEAWEARRGAGDDNEAAVCHGSFSWMRRERSNNSLQRLNWIWDATTARFVQCRVS